MRCDRATPLVLVAIGTLAILPAQTKIDLSSQARRIDFSNAPAVKPIPVGSALPATCGLGEMFFKRDANAGENLYVCPATNIWTQISGTATMLRPGTAGGILVVSNTAANFDVDADTMFLASQAGNNLFTGLNDFSGAANLRIAMGSAEPPADGCDTASETGSIYMVTGNTAKSSLLYVCQATVDGYGWRMTTYAYDTAPPSTCSVGQVFFDTDATPGQNWLGCTAANTWTILGSAARSYAQGTTPPATCALGDAFFDTDALAGENWLGCTAANTWTVLGKMTPRSYAQGTTPPAACTLGDAFFDTDATPGQNWLGCTASNTWTVLGSMGSSYARGAAPPATCVVGDAFFNTSAVAGQNWLGCTASNTWTVLGGTTSYARGTTPPATCVVGDAFFNTSATPGQNWLGCTASNTWTVLGGTTSYSRGGPLSAVYLRSWRRVLQHFRSCQVRTGSVVLPPIPGPCSAALPAMRGGPLLQLPA